MINVSGAKDKTPSPGMKNGACFTTHQNLFVQRVCRQYLTVLCFLYFFIVTPAVSTGSFQYQLRVCIFQGNVISTSIKSLTQ